MTYQKSYWLRFLVLKMSYFLSLINSPAVDFEGETSPDSCWTEDHSGVWSSSRPPPCTPAGEVNKPCVQGSERCFSGLSIPSDKSQEEGSAGWIAKASRSLPGREPHSAQKAALPAGENCQQAASVGSKERVTAAGKDSAFRTRQPRISWGWIALKGQRTTVWFS